MTIITLTGAPRNGADMDETQCSRLFSGERVRYYPVDSCAACWFHGVTRQANGPSANIDQIKDYICLCLGRDPSSCLSATLHLPVLHAPLHLLCLPIQGKKTCIFALEVSVFIFNMRPISCRWTCLCVNMLLLIT